MRFIHVLMFASTLCACTEVTPLTSDAVDDLTDGGPVFDPREPDGCAPVRTTIFLCDPQPVDAGGCNIQLDFVCNSSGCSDAQRALLPHLDASYPVGCGVWLSVSSTAIPPNHCWTPCTCEDHRDAGSSVGPAWSCPL